MHTWISIQSTEYCIITILSKNLSRGGHTHTRMQKFRTGRLCDTLSYRITTVQRLFVEKYASERNISICEAARIFLDEAMARSEDSHEKV